jgi:hypothetical protein
MLVPELVVTMLTHHRKAQQQAIPPLIVLSKLGHQATTSGNGLPSRRKYTMRLVNGLQRRRLKSELRSRKSPDILSLVG